MNYPGLLKDRFGATDIAHAVRSCSQGNLGDTQWAKISAELQRLDPSSDQYSVQVILEALHRTTASAWVDANENALLSELCKSQRAGEIEWELIGNQSGWRPRQG